ncbi:MAG: ABC transporter ATP-binding protein [Gammaproteobacteria bacterium]|nr:ABC transporter ATP-binding protein [Gammaproteobacteria bacterium]
MNVADATPLLSAEALHTYYGASHILHGVDLAVRPGETVSLLGRNGMGKTTTLRSLVGLTPPRRGRIMIHGKEMTRAAPHRIAREGIAFVPEDRGIFPNLSVRENLVMAARPGRDGRNDWGYDRVLELFPRLHQRLGNLGNQLSGGEQQMLTVARALLTNPELIILDEATEGLAPLIRHEIWRVIREIKQTGMASIIVDKDLKTLLRISDRCVILAKGQVVYEGTAQELAARPEVHMQHLGV